MTQDSTLMDIVAESVEEAQEDDNNPEAELNVVQNVNLAFNQLTDLAPLERLHNLRELNAANNRITRFPVGQWPSVTHLNLNNNEISQLSHVCMPRLLVLSLNNNRIRRLNEPGSEAPYFTAEHFPRLHTLQIAQNKLYLLDSTPNDPNAPLTLDIQLPQLRALFLGGNALTSLAVYIRQLTKVSPRELSEDQSQLDDQELIREEIVKERGRSALGILPELSVLNLRSNGIRELDGLTLETVPKLQYLNLRENMIDSMEEIEKLQPLNRLQTMILLENPIFEMKDYRLEMRVAVQSLRRLDKEVYTSQENEEADLLADQRKQERSTAEVINRLHFMNALLYVTHVIVTDPKIRMSLPQR
ncbi:unnamed protein product [Echinostoma caproni]|uniref:Leucine-rich repeat-containing protein 23 n=1 Tax=Echinostoma caproni TaxID=27848 RepID=A0A183AK75_9TREM|nr:unnamed protein product [Echinostoma caproni]